MANFFYASLTLVLVAVLSGLILDSRLYPIDPLTFFPERLPKQKPPFTPLNATRIADGLLSGPEDVVLGADGRLYCSSSRGWIQRIYPNLTVENWVQTGGHPLGLEWTPSGELAIADAYKGLLLADKSGSIKVLANEFQGRPFRLVDNLDVDSNGRIYFTDSSDKFDLSKFRFDVLEMRPRGRLFVYDTSNAKLELLLENLYFANGVALSQNEDFLLIAETSRYRIRKFWLKGPKAGSDDIFLDNLSGFPDNINSNHKGIFWVALMKPRSKLTDFIHGYPTLKCLCSLLPTKMIDLITRSWGHVFSVDENGNVVRRFEDPDGTNIVDITSAREYDGKLYLGSFLNNYLATTSL